MLEGKGSFKNMRRQKPVVFCVSVLDLSAHSVCVCVHTQYRTQYRRVCTRAQVKLNVDNHNLRSYDGKK